MFGVEELKHELQEFLNDLTIVSCIHENDFTESQMVKRDKMDLWKQIATRCKQKRES